MFVSGECVVSVIVSLLCSRIKGTHRKNYNLLTSCQPGLVFFRMLAWGYVRMHLIPADNIHLFIPPHHELYTQKFLTCILTHIYMGTRTYGWLSCGTFTDNIITLLLRRSHLVMTDVCDLCQQQHAR